MANGAVRLFLIIVVIVIMTPPMTASKIAIMIGVVEQRLITVKSVQGELQG